MLDLCDTGAERGPDVNAGGEMDLNEADWMREWEKERVKRMWNRHSLNRTFESAREDAKGPWVELDAHYFLTAPSSTYCIDEEWGRRPWVTSETGSSMEQHSSRFLFGHVDVT